MAPPADVTGDPGDRALTESTPSAAPSVVVAVLAYGDEPCLRDCVEAVLASRGVDATVRLVDNGCPNPDLQRLAALPGVTLLSPSANTGFAGGCNLALEGVTSDYVALVNSDAIVHADALAALVAVADQPDVGVASASLRLGDRPALLNSRGNPLHFTGLVWAGGLGEPAEPVTTAPSPVACMTGAAALLGTRLWRELGGFPEEFFAYQEDVELSLRCWLTGRRVMHVPAAVAVHHYEFSRNPNKMYLLERNRWVTVLTCFPTPLLRRVLPAMLALEVGLGVAAAVGGWLPQKVKAWIWLWTHLSWLRARRRQVQATVRGDGSARLASLMTPRFSPGVALGPRPVIRLLNLVFAGYWRMVGPRLDHAAQDGDLLGQ